MRTARSHGMETPLFDAVEQVNTRQKQRLFELVQKALGNVAGRTVAVWGLSFKAETDDMRESPAIDLVESLLAAGAEVTAHDPVAMNNARHIFGERITLAADPYGALTGADALVIVTEWLVFRNPDFSRIKNALGQPIIVDGRNLFSPVRLRNLGLTYVSFGRS